MLAERWQTFIEGCAHAYCPLRGTPKPTLCDVPTTEIRSMKMIEKGAAWQALLKAIIVHDHGVAGERTWTRIATESPGPDLRLRAEVDSSTVTVHWLSGFVGSRLSSPDADRSIGESLAQHPSPGGVILEPATDADPASVSRVTGVLHRAGVTEIETVAPCPKR